MTTDDRIRDADQTVAQGVDPRSDAAVSTDDLAGDLTGDPAVMELYARTADRYDRLNTLISFGTSNWYRRRTILSLKLPKDATLVDVGCGTGVLTLAAQRFLPDSTSIVGVDPCSEMRALAEGAGVRDVRPGSFSHIPVDDSSRDAVVSGYAIRYAEDLDEAFREIRRVLRPGGRLVLLEMMVPRSPRGHRAMEVMIKGVGSRVFAIACGSWSVRDLLRHFWDSISSFAPRDVVLGKLKDAGFTEIEYRPAGGLLGEFRATAPVG
ncbi:MAG: hypothetical protein CMJ51_01170 [Planctomycetaceae bacterium]|nr:hypothetical protein [Planctomycetaceae bacterium]